MFDGELELVYYNYRHYNPHDGRWISRDPITEQEELNLYAFVRNNPATAYDRWGNTGIYPSDLVFIKQGTEDIPIEYYYTEISMKDVDKWYALEFLIKKLGIPKEEVMAIGDNVNDRKMIEEAGKGIVMGGSTPKVSEVADYITLDCNNEGVAKAIEKFIV